MAMPPAFGGRQGHLQELRGGDRRRPARGGAPRRRSQKLREPIVEGAAFPSRKQRGQQEREIDPRPAQRHAEERPRTPRSQHRGDRTRRETRPAATCPRTRGNRASPPRGSTPASCVCAADAVDQDVGGGLARSWRSTTSKQSTSDQRTPSIAAAPIAMTRSRCQIEAGRFGVDHDVAGLACGTSRSALGQAPARRAGALPAPRRPSDRRTGSRATPRKGFTTDRRSQPIEVSASRCCSLRAWRNASFSIRWSISFSASGSIAVGVALRRRRRSCWRSRRSCRKWKAVDGRRDVPRLDAAAARRRRAAAPPCRSPAMPNASANTRAASTKMRVPRTLRSSVPAMRALVVGDEGADEAERRLASRARSAP